MDRICLFSSTYATIACPLKESFKLSEMEPAERGVRLGKYSLVAEIARGGMGIVYLAQASGRGGFKKLVVVKELKPELAEDERFREMFLNEASLAARLNHRNIVQTIEVDQDGDRFFFVMEYLEGRTLHHVTRLKGEKALSTAMILRIICDMLAGLHYAHELTDYDGTPLNIVHRDVSPRNVFLTYDGQVKLLDFGVAKAAGRDLETETGQLKGRVPYMAPEHLRDAPIDRRADVFSTGVMLREALTGRYLWGKATEIEILRQLLESKLPPLPPDVKIDDEAKAIIAKSMAPNRDDRYKTAHEMRTALERYVARIDPKGSFAQAGEHISREFSAQRTEIRVMIEEHVTRAPSILPGELPQLSMSSAMKSADGSFESTPSGRRFSQGSSGSSGNVGGFGTPSSGNVARATTPTSSNAMLPPPGATSSNPLVPPGATSSNPLAPPAAPSSSNVLAQAGSSVGQRPVIKDISIPPPPPPSPVGRYVMYALGFVVVVVGLTAAMLSTRDTATSTADNSKPPGWTAPTHMPTGRPTTPTASTSAAPPPPLPSDIYEITIFVNPPSAEILVDGFAVGESPYTAKWKRGSKHVVKASVPGYVPRVETIDVTATTSMNLGLEKEGGAAPPVFRAHPVRPQPAPPPPPAASPAPDAGS